MSAEIDAAGEGAAVAFGAVRADQWQRTGIRSNGSQFTVADPGRVLPARPGAPRMGRAPGVRLSSGP